MNQLCKFGLLIFAFVVMSGCASMSAQECQTADWHTIGYEDGARGLSADAIGRHRKACAKSGITANFGAYEEGRQQGVRQYCRPANGYQMGRKGGNYNGVCPLDMEDEFVIAFNEGRELYDLENNVRTVERDLRRVEKQIDDAEDELKGIERALISPESNTEDRVRLLGEAKELAGEVGELENQRDHLIYELGASKERLQEYLSARSL